MGELLDFLNAYRVSAQHIASLLLAAAIWRWGGAPERWLISIFLATMVVPIYVIDWMAPGPAESGPLAPFVFLLDLAAAMLFVAIALNANRNYPLWIAAFQMVAVVAHLVKAMVDSISPLAFAILVIGPSYCQLLLIFGGFGRHWLRERRFGPYREWRLTPPGLNWLRP